MMFGRNRGDSPEATDDSSENIAEAKEPTLLIIGSKDLSEFHSFREGLRLATENLTLAFAEPQEIETAFGPHIEAVLYVFPEISGLDAALEQVTRCRREREDGLPVLIIASSLTGLTDLGGWLYQTAVQDRLEGIRLMVVREPSEIVLTLPSRLSPVKEPNVIKMPLTTEVETTDYKYFYTISPELRTVVTLMRELAENNIARVYLLGGPGTGKTSVAYYYWLCRNKGRFITVNLTAESTDDKASMKSLLCGHVAGAHGNNPSREGALAFAEDGVCFLDESHGVTGVVMQVLMEVLDSGQYLPFGGTKKRMLNCAVILASNRSWDTLRNQMHLDEYARLGTTIMRISDLKEREEDLIAVLCSTLAKFANQCNTWTPPRGITSEAWELLLSCPWNGNIRTLIRVVETAAISAASTKSGHELIEAEHVQDALAIWEPETHPSMHLYAS